MALLVVLAAAVLPTLLGWQVFTRADEEPHGIAPLHALWEPKWFGPGTLPAVLLALVALAVAAHRAERLPWRALLAASFVVSAAWMLTLAAVDGRDGLDGRLLHPYEYLATAREMDDVRQPRRVRAADPLRRRGQLAGARRRPPTAATLFFVRLVRLGLSDLADRAGHRRRWPPRPAPAVLVTLRPLDARGRRPAGRAVPRAHPGGGVHGGLGRCRVRHRSGLGLAAAGAGRDGPVDGARWSACAVASPASSSARCVMVSYGLPLMGPLALAVLVAAAVGRPLPIAARPRWPSCWLRAVGFSWWEAFPVLRERYYDGHRLGPAR